jgi:hypothetical protein
MSQSAVTPPRNTTPPQTPQVDQIACDKALKIAKKIALCSPFEALAYFTNNPDVVAVLSTSYIPKADKKADALKRRLANKRRRERELNAANDRFNSWLDRQKLALQSKNPETVRALFISDEQLGLMERSVAYSESVKLVKECVGRHATLENLAFISAIRLGCILATFKLRFLRADKNRVEFWRDASVGLSVRQINKYIQLFDIVRAYPGLALMETSMHEFFEHWPRLERLLKSDSHAADTWKLVDTRLTKAMFSLTGTNPQELLVAIQPFVDVAPTWQRHKEDVYDPEKDDSDVEDEDETEDEADSDYSPSSSNTTMGNMRAAAKQVLDATAKALTERRKSPRRTSSRTVATATTSTK